MDTNDISDPSLNSSRSLFPRNPEDFDGDPRISFSKADNKFILETEDGQEYEFDHALKRWVPVVRSQLLTTSEGAPCAACITAFHNGW